jgi:FkbM family methyltransferase
VTLCNCRSRIAPDDAAHPTPLLSTRKNGWCRVVKTKFYRPLPPTEAIAPLSAARRARHHYYTIALGERDGRTTLFVPANKFAASLAPRQPAPEQTRLGIDQDVFADMSPRDVQIARLDTLLRDRVIPHADFLKLDCEANEPAILQGAQTFLASKTLLGIQSEASFLSSGEAQSHFCRILDQIHPYGFRIADIAMGRFAYRSFAERAATLGRKRAVASAAGPVAAMDVLFIRDLTLDSDSVSPDSILKSAMILELYGLNDMAHDLLTTLRASFPPNFGIAPAADRLIYTIPTTTSGIAKTLSDLGTAVRRSLAYRRNWRALR